jgi:sulfite exporter TauE/SafE
VRWRGKARQYELIREIEADGCLVFDPHVVTIEDGGMKTIDDAQIRFKRRADPLGAFVFGLTTGLLPCGLLYTALAFPIGARDPLLGALLMGVFALGTLPALAAARAGLRWVHRQGLLTRRLVASLVFVLGLSALLTRSGGLLSGQAAAPGAPPPCHTPA